MSVQDAIQPQPSQTADASPGDATAQVKPPVIKSWRRKYRKMVFKFASSMRESDDLILKENKMERLARRLQEQNDQLLDLLLDLNENARLPSHTRYDLRSPSPTESAIPSLETDDQDPEATRREKGDVNATYDGNSFSSKHLPLGSKSFATLLKIPHTKFDSAKVPEEMLLGEYAPGYLSPTHEDEYLQTLDNSLLDVNEYNPDNRSGRPMHHTKVELSDKELSLRNPDSVYNWLRKYHPGVFLQDKEKDHELASEKSGPKPAGNRGKRLSTANIAVSTPGPKADHDALDDEMGFIPETGTTSARSKKNKDDDAYRPKGGGGRGKRKRDDSEKGPRKRQSKIGLGH